MMSEEIVLSNKLNVIVEEIATYCRDNKGKKCCDTAEKKKLIAAAVVHFFHNAKTRGSSIQSQDAYLKQELRELCTRMSLLLSRLKRDSKQVASLIHVLDKIFMSLPPKLYELKEPVKLPNGLLYGDPGWDIIDDERRKLCVLANKFIHDAKAMDLQKDVKIIKALYAIPVCEQQAVCDKVVKLVNARRNEGQDSNLSYPQEITADDLAKIPKSLQEIFDLKIMPEKEVN